MISESPASTSSLTTVEVSEGMRAWLLSGGLCTTNVGTWSDLLALRSGRSLSSSRGSGVYPGIGDSCGIGDNRGVGDRPLFGIKRGDAGRPPGDKRGDAGRPGDKRPDCCMPGDSRPEGGIPGDNLS